MTIEKAYRKPSAQRIPRMKQTKQTPPPALTPGPITVTFSCDRNLNEWLETKSRDKQLPKGALVRLFLIERRSLEFAPGLAPRVNPTEPAIITVREAKARAGKGAVL